MSESTYLGRNISIAYRLSNRFYDRVLSPYQIGCGQQFFLLRIYENQGISMYDLARMGRFDKGSVTRAVQKLEEQGYVRCVPDERDKRVRRLYTADMVEPIAKAVNEADAAVPDRRKRHVRCGAGGTGDLAHPASMKNCPSFQRRGNFS